jgi:hypothetical protein
MNRIGEFTLGHSLGAIEIIIRKNTLKLFLLKIGLKLCVYLEASRILVE